MKAIQLFFRGHAYPSVAVSRQLDLIIHPTAVSGFKRRFEERAGFHFVATIPKAIGREWKASEARGFWRTFREIDWTSPDDVKMIFNRYGDPDDLLDKQGFSTTAAWIDHQKLLGIAACAWEEPDADGVSYQTKDEQRLRESRNFLGEWPVVTRLVQDRKTGGLVPKAGRLADYMTISAAMMIAAATPMKRCAHCDHWFGFHDIRAQFCSVSCRNSAHRAKKQEAR